ncbi:MAG: signal peptide peptidase SppA [Nitrospirae bacterium]|nr:signal peptide peptidase SppA [Nitrospirota bacterium]MDA1303619.1 signal peptide peptidase SppA [Nitrospirota bacterium]
MANRIILLIVISVALLLSGCMSPGLFPKTGPLEETEVSGKGKDKILIVDVSGLLTSSQSSDIVDRLFNRPSLPTRFKEELSKAAEDNTVKGIVLRINTPGGTVTASDILYHEVQEFKKAHKIPVVASIMDLGTSGGYYLAAASDRIVAHPSAVTGSLGVIMLTLNGSGLMEKIGIEANTITSGKHKDMGSPFRKMTSADRAIFQSVIDSFYQRFLDVIEQGRPNLTKEKIRQLADGRIYSAPQAKEAGLIDEIGYLEDAIEVAKQQAGLTEAKVVMYQRAGGYHPNMYSQFSGNVPNTSLMIPKLDAVSLATILGGTPAFMYMWLP